QQPSSVAVPALPPEPTPVAPRRRWPWLLVAAALLFGMGGSLLLQGNPDGAKERPAPKANDTPGVEFVQDFRGALEIKPPLTYFGRNAEKYVRLEPEGLRITTPVIQGEAGFGVVLPVRLRGDFEVAVSYELLRAERPTAGHGVGVQIAIGTDSPKDMVIEIG